MQVFNAVVRLQDSLMNEVPKRGLTVPEIYILRRIHGAGAVVKIEHVGDTVVDGLEERTRLSYLYDGGLAALNDDQKTSVRKMFGEEYASLPEELQGYSGKLVKREDDLENYQREEPYSDAEADEEAKMLRTGKRTKAKAAAVAAAKGSAKVLDKVM